MQSRVPKLAALLILQIGLAACQKTASEPGLCEALPVEALAQALLAHPETAPDVGNAGADVVIGFRAGCESGGRI